MNKYTHGLRGEILRGRYTNANPSSPNAAATKPKPDSFIEP